MSTPPVGTRTAYAFEMTNEQHEELADKLNSVRGRVAFSNYDSDFLDQLYPARRWFKHVLPAKTESRDEGENGSRFFGRTMGWGSYYEYGEDSPGQVLARLYAEANNDLTVSQITNSVGSTNMGYVVRCPSNRAGARLLLSCMLAKVHRPEVDPREPYTEIGGQTCFSGRTYDEQYITEFINEYNLPCNNTTAYLTPAFRNHSAALALGTTLNGVRRRCTTVCCAY